MPKAVSPDQASCFVPCQSFAPSVKPRAVTAGTICVTSPTEPMVSASSSTASAVQPAPMAAVVSQVHVSGGPASHSGGALRRGVADGATVPVSLRSGSVAAGAGPSAAVGTESAAAAQTATTPILQAKRFTTWRRGSHILVAAF